MDFGKMMTDVKIPEIKNPMAPRREIPLSREEVATVGKSIAILKKSRSNQEKLFEIFDDWQTKKTLTAKRILVSTSIIVVAASWIGIEYKDLSFFGLKIASGSPERFIVFILMTILLSGFFYEISRRIDLAVQKAKIKNVSQDLKVLKKPVDDIGSVMKRNNISSFSDLYFDFQSLGTTDRDAINAFNAVHFYREYLVGANQGLNVLAVIELGITYLISGSACVALLYSLI